MQIIRYLEYNWEEKKTIKIEEKEVYALLNDNLRDKITVCINGRILQNLQVFDSFSIEFLSKLTFAFVRKSYVVDEIIFHVSFKLHLYINLIGGLTWLRTLLHKLGKGVHIAQEDNELH